MTNQLYLDKRITRFFNVAPEPLYRVHHIAAPDGMHKKPTEYMSALMTESEAIAKVDEIKAKGVDAWKVTQS